MRRGGIQDGTRALQDVTHFLEAVVVGRGAFQDAEASVGGDRGDDTGVFSVFKKVVEAGRDAFEEQVL